MKFKLCFAALVACSLLATQASAQTVIASFDTYENATGDFTVRSGNAPTIDTPSTIEIGADFAVSNVDVNITENPTDPIFRRIRSNSGSQNNTFGNDSTLLTLPTASGSGQLQFFNAGTANGGTGIATADEANFFLNVTNNDASETLVFDEVLFDLLVQSNGTHSEYSVLFENTTLGTASGILDSGTATVPGGGSQTTDVTFDTGPGIQLAAGQSGRFVFTIGGGLETSTSSGNIDNIALIGSLGEPAGIPEPSSLALLGLGAIGLVSRRRR